MSDFNTKMHKIRFRLGSVPDPTEGAYSAPPDLLAVFYGPTKERTEEEGRWKSEGRGGGNEGRARPPKYFGLEPPLG